MGKWKQWKYGILAAGVIASAVFYAGSEAFPRGEPVLLEEAASPGEESRVRAMDPVSPAVPGEEVAGGQEQSPPEGTEGMEDPEAADLPAGSSPEDLEELIRRAVREEIQSAAREGYLESAFLQAALLEVSRAEARKEMVDLNTADLEELMTLPGIGKQRARDILAYREAAGGFSSAEDIMKVSGIKEAAYDRIKDKIYVD